MKLYTQHYTEKFKGKDIVFASREGVLRKNYAGIVQDLRFLIRQGINVTLFHNIQKNKGNESFLYNNFEKYLGSEVLLRIPKGEELYKYVLEQKLEVLKLIFLENQCLNGLDGKRINTLTTNEISKILCDNNSGIHLDHSSKNFANINFNSNLRLIVDSIEGNRINRVHILPSGRKKNAIREELFSIDGSGTLISNDFGLPEIEQLKEFDIPIVKGLIDTHLKEGFLKERSLTYIKENIDNFLIARLDDILVGCVEVSLIDGDTLEVGALTVSTSFHNFKIGGQLILEAENLALNQGKDLISFTNNPVLQKVYLKKGFVEDNSNYEERRKQSPGVSLFKKKFIK